MKAFFKDSRFQPRLDTVVSIPRRRRLSLTKTAFSVFSSASMSLKRIKSPMNFKEEKKAGGSREGFLEMTFDVQLAKTALENGVS